MKNLILIFKLIFVSIEKTGEITIQDTGKAEISLYTFNDHSSYKLYRSNGNWKSSTWDFGLHICLSTVISEKNVKNGFNITKTLLKKMTIL